MTNNKFESRLNFNNDNYEKELLKHKNDFDYLKAGIYEFDKFKHNLDKLGITWKQKELIVKLASKYIYDPGNKLYDVKKTFEGIKEINNVIEHLQKWDKTLAEIFEEIKEKYSNKQNIERSTNITLGTILIIVSLVSIISVGLRNPVASLLFGTILGFTYFSTKEILVDPITQQQKERIFLLDMVNDIYPDITEQDLQYIQRAYDNGQFNIDKFNKILEKYYQDWKITPEEHKDILRYLKALT